MSVKILLKFPIHRLVATCVDLPPFRPSKRLGSRLTAPVALVLFDPVGTNTKWFNAGLLARRWIDASHAYTVCCDSRPTSWKNLFCSRMNAGEHASEKTISSRRHCTLPLINSPETARAVSDRNPPATGLADRRQDALPDSTALGLLPPRSKAIRLVVRNDSARGEWLLFFISP